MDGTDQEYQEMLKAMMAKLKAAGVKPCEKHGWISMNLNNTCEACRKEDFPEDWAGTE